METKNLLQRVNAEIGTDPTYKEWKLAKQIFAMERFISTDPTYKEWKRVTQSIQDLTNARTDPTYKEWKLCS